MLAPGNLSQELRETARKAAPRHLICALLSTLAILFGDIRTACADVIYSQAAVAGGAANYWTSDFTGPAGGRTGWWTWERFSVDTDSTFDQVRWWTGAMRVDTSPFQAVGSDATIWHMELRDVATNGDEFRAIQTLIPTQVNQGDFAFGDLGMIRDIENSAVLSSPIALPGATDLWISFWALSDTAGVVDAWRQGTGGDSISYQQALTEDGFGSFETRAGDRAFELSVVPEPSGIATLATFLIIPTCYRRKRCERV